MLNKTIWVNFQRIIELFTQKIVPKLSKIWVLDPGSEKTYFGSRIPDPGVKKALKPGFQIPDPDPHHWSQRIEKSFGSRIPDSGSRGQKGTGSRIPNPGSGSATLIT
jgi:hypothetical protein